MSSGLFQIGGLASGLDTHAIIDALVNVERNKIRIVESKQVAHEYTVSGYGTLLSKLNDLEAESNDLGDPDAFDLFKNNSSDDEHVTIEGSAGAIQSEYLVTVFQKASAEKLSSLSGKITDDLAPLVTVPETITINGVDLDIDTNDSVRDLVYKINAATDTDGEKLTVRASYIKASANDYRLIFTSTEEGVANEMSLSGTLFQTLGILDGTGQKGNIAQSQEFTSGLPLPQTGPMGATGSFVFTGTDHNGEAVSGSFALNGKTTEELLAYIETAFRQTVDATVDAAGTLKLTDRTTGASQMDIAITDDGNLALGAKTTTAGVQGLSTIAQARDAFFSVDGVAIQAESNAAEDVVNGVTFNLLKADPLKEITVSLERDYDEVKKSIQKFLNSYNSVASYLKESTTYWVSENEENDRAGSDGPLAGEWTASRVRNDLRSVITTQFNEWGTDATNNALIRIGIETDPKTGKLEIDDDRFKDVFEAEFESIVRLFTPSGASDNGNIAYGRSTSDTQNGKYELQRIDDTFWQIRLEGDATWYTSDARAGEIMKFSSGPASGLSITIPLSVTADASFTFTQGIAKMMNNEIKEMTHTRDGYVAQTRDAAQKRIDGYEDKIFELEIDLEDYRRRLLKQFSDLETSMASLQSQSGMLMSALGTYR